MFEPPTNGNLIESEEENAVRRHRHLKALTPWRPG